MALAGSSGSQRVQVSSSSERQQLIRGSNKTNRSMKQTGNDIQPVGKELIKVISSGWSTKNASCVLDPKIQTFPPASATATGLTKTSHSTEWLYWTSTAVKDEKASMLGPRQKSGL
jgi:hypothetical protein